MSQTPTESIKEVLINTGIGFVGAWIITYLTFRFVPTTAVAATVSCVTCTIWSILRGYFVRRYFNRRK